MTANRDFLDEGFRAVGDGLLRIVDRASLHLQPLALTKRMRRRCMAGMRQLTLILRRLLFLLALSIVLPPAKPRHRSGAACPDGVEDVTATFRAPVRGIALVPGLSGAFPERLRSLTRVIVSGPVPAAPVLARWAALHRILQAPDAHARRLAQTLRRWRLRGEPRPLVAPLAGAHRFSPALGLVAAVLPVHLKRALEAWPDTG
ncbi:MAG: hypothetical protein R3C13_02045 [Hyphomonas sp.]|uniref:hypothetical protein n=1 Tax=Hyphomonas sp. TaxID=87 RepID=UPI0035286039